MTVENYVRTLRSDLISAEDRIEVWNENVKGLSVYLNAWHPNEIGGLLPVLFDKSYGLIKCIEVSSHRVTQIKPLLKLVQKLADHSGHLPADHVVEVMDICYKLKSEVIECCKILCATVKKAPRNVVAQSLENKLVELVRRYKSEFFTSFRKENYNLFNPLKYIPILEALELLLDTPAENNTPNELESYFEEIWQEALNNKHKLMLLLPLTNILSVMHNRYPLLDKSKSLYGILYEKTIAISNPSCGDYDEMSTLLTKTMHMYVGEVLDNLEFWHKYFLGDMEKRLEISADATDCFHSINYPIYKFYQELFSSKVLELKTHEYFSVYLNSALKKQSRTEVKFCDASCLLMWCLRCPNDFSYCFPEDLFESLVHFTISSLNRSDDVEMYLASIATQSLCIIIGKNISLFEKYQQLVGNLMDALVLHDLNSKTSNDYIVHALQLCIYSVPSEPFIKNIVQRLMWHHCSLKWPVCPAQQIDNSCSGSHSQLWKKLVDFEVFYKYVNGMWKRGDSSYTRSEFEKKFKIVWDSIIEFIFHVSSTLNFSLCKNDFECQNDVKMSVLTRFRAVSSGDMTFHYNAVQLLLCIINQVPKLVSNEWNHSFILEASILSATYPYVSGFCKLVTIGLKVRENSEAECRSEMEKLEPFFLKCFYHCKIFDGELQLSYIYLLLSIPTECIVGFLDELLPFFQIVFELSKSNSQLATRSLFCIRKWMVNVGRDKFTPILSSLVPLIVPLLRIESGSGWKRKRKQTVKISEDFRELLILLDYVDSSVLDSFFSTIQYNVNSSTKLPNLLLPSNDLPITIKLESILPHVFFLSTHSSNIEERLHSCELLHFIGCYMLGKGSDVTDEGQPAFSELFRKVSIQCLILSLDRHPTIMDIFRTFLFQCTNVFSSKLALKELGQVFIKSLLDYMMLPTRNVGLEICCNLLRNLLKTEHSDSYLFQTNLDMMFHIVAPNLVHSCWYRRKGAAIALLSVEQALLAETRNFDKYYLYILYLVITNLSMYRKDFDHILKILEVLNKAVDNHHDVLHKVSESRISPPGFESITLRDMISWLTAQAVSSNLLVTTECCSLLSRFASYLSAIGIQDMEAMIEEFVISSFTDRNFKVFSKLDSEIQCPTTTPSQVIELLQKLKVTCHMRFFVWLLGNYSAEILLSQNMRFIEVIGSTFNYLSNNLTHENTTRQNWRFWELETSFNPYEEFFFVFLNLREKMEDLQTTGTLNNSNKISDFSSFLIRFLVEPSSLNVRFYTHEYHVWSKNLLKKSDPTESGSRLQSDLLTKIDQLLLDLSETLTKALSDSQLELLHCLDLVRDSGSSQKEFRIQDAQTSEKMKMLLKNFSEVLVSSVTHRNWNSHKRHLSKLLHFIFSLGTFDQVCCALFNLMSSGANKGLAFYDLFEHDIFIYTIQGIKEDHWMYFGDGSSNVILDILNKYFATSKSVSTSTIQKFAMCVKKYIDMRWETIASSIETDSNLFSLLNCLLQVGNSLIPDANSPLLKPDIEEWVQNNFHKCPSHLQFPLYPYLGSTSSSTLQANFDDMDEFYLHVMCHSFLANLLRVVSFCLDKMRNPMKLNEAYDFISSKLKDRDGRPISHRMITMGNEGTQFTRPQQYFRFDAIYQGLILHHFFQRGLELDVAQLSGHLDRFSRQISLSATSVCKKFISEITARIVAIISTEFDHLNAEREEFLLNQKTICFFLIKYIFYGMFDENEVCELDGFQRASSDDKIHKTIIKWCYVFQSYKTSYSSCVESWRLCQCTALNCLLFVLNCHNNLSSEVLKKFVFRFKTHKTTEPILETVIDPNEQLNFISWKEAKLINKKKQKVVYTGSKIPLAESGYVDTFSTPTQECKAFDFFGSRDKLASSSIIQIDLEGDSLSNHLCLPYLCATIIKAVEVTTLSSSVEVMPDWMFRLKQIFIKPDVSKNVKSFIIKILHKCKDVFKLYAAFWIRPILYNIVTHQCCGAETTYFFHEVITMLISWLPPKHNVRNSSEEEELWDKLVERVISGILSSTICDDVSHLLQLLRLILDNKSGISPCHTAISALIAALTEKKPNRYALKVFCILFESGYHPFTAATQKEFLDALVGNQTLEIPEVREDAALVIGYALHDASEADLETYSSHIVCELNKFDQPNTRGHLFSLLQSICRNHPPIATEFLTKAFAHLNNPKSNTLHRNIMGVLKTFVSFSPSAEVFNELKQNRWFEFLASNSSTYGVKLCGLSILKSFVDNNRLLPDVMHFIIRFIMNHLDQFSSFNLRSLVYDIMASASHSAQFDSDSEPKLDSWFLKRFWEESNAELHGKLVRCIIDDRLWKGNTRQMTIKLLEVLPDVIEKRTHPKNTTLPGRIPIRFVKTLLLRYLDLQSAEHYIFGEPTAGNDIEESPIAINFPLRDLSPMLPLFVETIQEGYEMDCAPMICESHDEPSKNPSLQLDSGKNLADNSSREIKLIRSYNKNKWPNINITFSETIVTLSKLCKVNSSVTLTVFQCLISNILSPDMDVDLVERLKPLIPTLLDKIAMCNSSGSTLVLSLLHICWNFRITLDPVLLYDVCKIFNTKEVGVLLSEEHLKSLSSTHEFLGHFYKILSIFHGDIGCVEISQSFTKMMENTSCRTDDSQETKTFSNIDEFKALALLNDWEQLNQKLGEPEFDDDRVVCLEMQKTNYVKLHRKWSEMPPTAYFYLEPFSR